MSNPFRTTDAWEVQTERLLGEGNHVVNITVAEDGTSSGRHPQIELQLANGDGEIRDWLVITPASVGKVVALAQAAGIDLPTDDDIADSDTLRLKQEYIDRLHGKVVGAVVRNEPSFKDPSRMIPRVQGYVAPEKIKPSDVTPAGAADPFKSQPSAPAAEDKIPF